MSQKVGFQIQIRLGETSFAISFVEFIVYIVVVVFFALIYTHFLMSNELMRIVIIWVPIIICGFLYSKIKNMSIEINALKEHHFTEINALKEHHFHDYPEEWLRSLDKRNYKNEIEVEMKFVLPLLMYLGYSLDDMRIRVPCSVRAGTQNIFCEADWVITQKSENGSTQKIVIEVKSSAHPLGDDAKEQVRSYAEALRISTCLVTNGSKVIVFIREVNDNRIILNLLVEEFVHNWNYIKKTLGSSPISQSRSSSKENQLSIKQLSAES